MVYLVLFSFLILVIFLHNFWDTNYLLWYLRIRATGNKLVLVSGKPTAKTKKVIISLTTIPSRIHHIFPTLNSLLLQHKPADRIYLNLPNTSIREGRSYAVPASIMNDTRVTIHMTEKDYGPITKLLPTLELEKDPETMIITVDDDIIYPPDMVERLIGHHTTHPEAALGFRSWNIPPSGMVKDSRILFAHQIRQPVKVDILEGMSGVLYLRKHFHRDFFCEDLPEEGFYVDDVCISGYLEKQGVARYLVPHRIREPLCRYVITSRSNPLWKLNKNGTNNQIMVDYYFKR